MGWPGGQVGVGMRTNRPGTRVLARGPGGVGLRAIWPDGCWPGGQLAGCSGGQVCVGLMAIWPGGLVLQRHILSRATDI